MLARFTSSCCSASIELYPTGMCIITDERARRSRLTDGCQALSIRTERLAFTYSSPANLNSDPSHPSENIPLTTRCPVSNILNRRISLNLYPERQRKMTLPISSANYFQIESGFIQFTSETTLLQASNCDLSPYVYSNLVSIPNFLPGAFSPVHLQLPSLS